MIQEFTFLLLFALVREGVCWPEGAYGLPMPDTGCPDSDSLQWLTGYRIQHTMPDSYGHPADNHFANISSSRSDRIQQDFCIKNTTEPTSDHHWMRGRYCIFKHFAVDCPVEFVEGSVYWDDAAPLSPYLGDTHQDFAGALPDGVYDFNTRISYCCRDDGSSAIGIELPTDKPFYLMRRGGTCQNVKSMTSHEEYIYWMDEQTFNLNSARGAYPDIRRTTVKPVKYTKMYYCYYSPLLPVYTISINYFRTFLIVLSIVAGIAVCTLVTMLSACLISCGMKIFSHRRGHTSVEEQSTTNSCLQHRLEVNPRTGCIVYNAQPNTPTSDAPSESASPVNGQAPSAMPTVGPPPNYNEAVPLSSRPNGSTSLSYTRVAVLPLAKKTKLLDDDREDRETDTMMRHDEHLPMSAYNVSPWNDEDGVPAEPPPYEDNPLFGTHGDASDSE